MCVWCWGVDGVCGGRECVGREDLSGGAGNWGSVVRVCVCVRVCT